MLAQPVNGRSQNIENYHGGKKSGPNFYQRLILHIHLVNSGSVLARIIRRIRYVCQPQGHNWERRGVIRLSLIPPGFLLLQSSGIIYENLARCR